MKKETKIQRIKQAMKETQSFIDRETKRDNDLRPIEIQILVNDYVLHNQKLKNMLIDLGAA